MNAAHDNNVDRFRLLDTAPLPESAYTLSYTAEISESQLARLKGKHGAVMKQVLHEEGIEPHQNTSDLKLPPGDGDHYQFKVLHDDGNGHYRIQVITDIERYLGFVEKSLYNRDVKTRLEQGKPVGPEDYTINTLAFDVTGDFQDKDEKLKTVPAKGVTEVPLLVHSRVIL